MVVKRWSSQHLSNPAFIASTLSFARYLLAKIRSLLPPNQQTYHRTRLKRRLPRALWGQPFALLLGSLDDFLKLHWLMQLLYWTRRFQWSTMGQVFSLAHDGQHREATLWKPSSPNSWIFRSLSVPLNGSINISTSRDCSLISRQVSLLDWSVLLLRHPFIQPSPKAREKQQSSLQSRTVEPIHRVDDQRLHRQSQEETRCICIHQNDWIGASIILLQQRQQAAGRWSTMDHFQHLFWMGMPTKLLRDGIIFLEESSENTQVMRFFGDWFFFV